MKCQDCQQELTGDRWLDREVHGRCPSEGLPNSDQIPPAKLEPNLLRGRNGPDLIIIPACALHAGEAIVFANEMLRLAESCNVATFVPIQSLFDSTDPNIFTLEVTNQLMTDFQKMRNSPKEDIRKTIIALMDFYSNHAALNIILTADVLEKRQSYIKFTAQLGNFLTHNQTHFTQVKVLFHSPTTRLGIFCRKGTEKSPLNASFLGLISAALKTKGSIFVDSADIPLSYLANRSMFINVLTKKVGKVKIIWLKTGVNIFNIPTNLS